MRHVRSGLCEGDEAQFVRAGIDPETTIETKVEIRGDFDQERHAGHDHHGGKIERDLAGVEAQGETTQHREDDEEEVEEEDEAVTNHEDEG